MTRVGGLLDPPPWLFGAYDMSLVFRSLGRVFRSAGDHFDVFCFRSLGRVFRSAGDHIFCSRLLGRVFRSAGNRISCFLDFYLLISRFLVIL